MLFVFVDIGTLPRKFFAGLGNMPMSNEHQGAEMHSDRVHIRANEAVKKLLEDAKERSAMMYTHGTLMVKVYAPRENDPQTPHTRDEIYVIINGTGSFFNGVERKPFGPGDFLFAPAGSVHRFEDFSNDFLTWVMYFGPEGGETPG